MAEPRPQYLLLADGYQALHCPHCDEVCYPDARAANGNIIYTSHKCRLKYTNTVIDYRFETDPDGNIITEPLYQQQNSAVI